MKTYKFLKKIKYYPIFIMLFCFLVGCGGNFFDPPDLRKTPGNAKEKREKKKGRRKEEEKGERKERRGIG